MSYFLPSRANTECRIESAKERDLELDGLASLDYHERITNFIRGSTRHSVKDSTTVLDFRPLYAVNVHHLQRQLAQQVQHMMLHPVTDMQLDHVQSLLAEYTSALRDFEFIHSNRFHTSFVKDIAASRIDDGPGSRLQAALLDELNLNSSPHQNTLYSDRDLLGSFDHSLIQHSPDLGKTRGSQRELAEAYEKRLSAIQEGWKRFAAAILGGLAIVAPVLAIMVPTAPPKVLAIVCASIFIFSLAVAGFSTASPENLLAATAAYAAVLTVFMGNYDL